MGAFFSKGEPYNYQRESNPLSLGDRLEFAYLLYEEFRKDPILEKRYYDTVWKVCFSSGVLIENPNILKKVILEFSEKKKSLICLRQLLKNIQKKDTNTSKISFMIPITFSTKPKLKNLRSSGTIEWNF